VRLLTNHPSVSSEHSFLSGIVLEDGQHFQVSNVPFQPPPPEGGHRDTFMRSDYFYADGDPVRWPQPLNHNDLYLAAIPTCHAEIDPLYIVLFINSPPGSPSFFSSSTSHFAHIDPKGVADIKRIQEHVEGRITDYLERLEFQQDSHSKKHIISNRRAYAGSFFSRLTNQPMTEPEMRRCFAEYQCFTLDIIAALDWDTIYRPRIEGQHSPASKVDDRMGVFTQDPFIGLAFEDSWEFHPPFSENKALLR
jgi:hypothetical protein